jgi:hypothetical protein
MASFSTWADVGDLLRKFGVTTTFIRQLAPNQDNEKNQIYLAMQRGASPFELIERAIPLTFRTRAPSTSKAKRKSHSGSPIVEGTVKWNWVDRNGYAHPAPNTKVIFYLQYPEIRLSGFIKGCDVSPLLSIKTVWSPTWSEVGPLKPDKSVAIWLCDRMAKRSLH